MNDGSDVLARQGVPDVLGMIQRIDDLELFEAFGALEQRQHRPFDDEII
jgi:hypothetical protein